MGQGGGKELINSYKRVSTGSAHAPLYVNIREEAEFVWDTYRLKKEPLTVRSRVFVEGTRRHIPTHKVTINCSDISLPTKKKFRFLIEVPSQEGP